jgi:hypothetical protein
MQINKLALLSAEISTVGYVSGREKQNARFFCEFLVLALVGAAIGSSASADDRAAAQPLREEVWGLMTPLPCSPTCAASG